MPYSVFYSFNVRRRSRRDGRRRMIRCFVLLVLLFILLIFLHYLIHFELLLYLFFLCLLSGPNSPSFFQFFFELVAIFAAIASEFMVLSLKPLRSFFITHTRFVFLFTLL